MMAGEGERTVVLVSGGLDSATVLAIAKSQGFRIFAITFDYQQRHSIELEAARRVADAMGVERHVVFPIDLRAFGGSALTQEMAVPKDRTEAEMESGIPVTYVPVRNTIFLSLAAAWAETLGAFDLFIGVNAIDYSGYPDCRPEFIDAFNTVLTLGTKAGVDGTGKWKVHAPKIRKDTLEEEEGAARSDLTECPFPWRPLPRPNIH